MMTVFGDDVSKEANNAQLSHRNGITLIWSSGITVYVRRDRQLTISTHTSCEHMVRRWPFATHWGALNRHQIFFTLTLDFQTPGMWVVIFLCLGHRICDFFLWQPLPTNLPYNPVTILFVIYNREMKTYAHTKSYAQIFIAVLFIVIHNWNHLSFNKWMGKLSVVYTHYGTQFSNKYRKKFAFNLQV